MATQEQTGPLPVAVVANGSEISSARILAGVTVTTVGAVALGAAWAFSAFGYNTIALLEGIHDGRAHQVTELYGYWLVVLWVAGLSWTLWSGQRKESVAKAGSFPRMPRSYFRALCLMLGASVSTLAFSALLIAVASLPFVVVTPPAAWLIMTAASLFGGITAVRTIN